MIQKLKITLKISISFLLLTLFTIPINSKAQSIYDNPEQLKLEILKQDSLFWTAYNTCDVDVMMSFVTDDIEFYHDKGGLTQGSIKFKKGLQSGLCANGQQLKRVAKEGTIKVFPLKDVGGIISGDHYFYIGERADGLAKFTHIWTLKEKEWKMSRVLSYDHKPVPIKSPEPIALSAAILSAYIGQYHGSNTGDVSIEKSDNHLKLLGPQFELELYPETEDTFFTKESQVRFQFIRETNGRVSKMIVLENGGIAEELVRIQ